MSGNTIQTDTLTLTPTPPEVVAIVLQMLADQPDGPMLAAMLGVGA